LILIAVLLASLLPHVLPLPFCPCPFDLFLAPLLPGVRASQGSHGSAVTDLKRVRLDVSASAPGPSGLARGRAGVVSCGLDGLVKVWAVAGDTADDVALALLSE
jgi:hypothetical protein